MKCAMGLILEVSRDWFGHARTVLYSVENHGFSWQFSESPPEIAQNYNVNF